MSPLTVNKVILFVWLLFDASYYICDASDNVINSSVGRLVFSHIVSKLPAFRCRCIAEIFTRVANSLFAYIMPNLHMISFEFH